MGGGLRDASLDNGGNDRNGEKQAGPVLVWVQILEQESWPQILIRGVLSRKWIGCG